MSFPYLAILFVLYTPPLPLCYSIMELLRLVFVVVIHIFYLLPMSPFFLPSTFFITLTVRVLPPMVQLNLSH